MKETVGGQGGETGGEEGNPNSAPFESGLSELRVWGKLLWILIRIYIPRVWGSDIYIYIWFSMLEKWKWKSPQTRY